MSQGAVYFNGGAGANGPQQFTRRWNTANSTLTENAGGFARHANTTSGTRKLLGYDAVPASHTQIECLTKTRTDTRISGGIYGGVAARATGAATAELGYAAVLIDNSGVASLRLYRFSPAGTSTALVTFAITTPSGGWAINEWWWVRLQLNGSTIRARCWKDGNAEGSTWDIDTTDANVTSGDWAGPYNFGLGNVDHDFFSFGTDGDIAPDYSTAVSELFNSASAFQPINFRRNWIINATTMTEVSGGYLRMAVATQARNGLFWDAIEPNANVEVLVKWRASAKAANQPSFQAFLRGSGAGAAENGYRFFLTETAGAELVVAKYTAGTAANIGTAQAFTWAVDTWYWFRCRVNGTTLTLKAWADGGSEPGSPQRTETDSSFSAAGMNGIVGFVVGNVDVDYISYATGGGTAPSPTGVYTMPVAAGVYDLTGNAVTLNGVRTMTAVAGAYTLTGIAVGLTKGSPTGYAVAVDTGLYTLTGNAATLSYSGAPPVVRPLIGFYYSQGNIANVTKPDALVGWPIQLAFEFTAFDTRSNLQAGITNLSAYWKNYNASNPTKKRRLYVSIATSTSDGGIKDRDLANGTTQDSFIDGLANTLINDGHGDALVRIGWEMNGGWYPTGNTWNFYYPAGDPRNFQPEPSVFAAAFRKVVDRFRARAAALGTPKVFEFVWAPAIGYGQSPPANYYPGDAHVDWIAPDAYGQVYDSRNKTPAELWDRDSWGYDADHAGGTPTSAGAGYQVYHLQWFAREALARGKKFGIAECGIGWGVNQDGFGDAGYWWQKVSEVLAAWGPPTGALLGVFDQGPPGTTDYYSRFTEAQNYKGTAPANYYDQKDRVAWAFRHYFGDLSVVSDLSTAAFETNAPSGVSVTLNPGFGTLPNCVIPLGTPDGTVVGQITVTGGERVWSIDAGQHDTTSNTGTWDPNNSKLQTLWVSDGFIAPGSSPQGGLLRVRGSRVSPLLGLTGKKQILGVRNALGGLNYQLNISVQAVAGTTKGWDFFDDASIAGTTEQWDGALVLWSEDATAPGYMRGTVTPTANSQRNTRQIDSPGYYANIDVATQIRFAAATPPYAPPTGTAYTIGGVVVRGGGSLGAETAYAAVLRIETDGTKQFVLRKYVNGALTNLAILQPASFVENTWYEIRLQAIGSTIKAKFWLASAAEPGTWDHTVTDTSITAAGFTGPLIGWGGQNTLVDFDYFGWDTIGGTPVPVAFSYRVSADASSYTLTGKPVSLRYAPIVGGILIGTAGTGIYTGKSLAWGDDFLVKPTMWNYRNLGGKWMPVGRGGDRRFNALEKQIFIDASYRGPRHESPTDLGIDPYSVAASVLSITAAVRDSSLDNHVPYNQNGSVVDAMDNQGRPLLTSGALRANPQFMLSVEGDWVIEVKCELAAGSISGYWPAALWITGLFRSSTKEWGEVDLQEGYQGASRVSHTYLHVPAAAGGVGATTQTVIVADKAVPTGRSVQFVAVRTGNTITCYDDSATAGTLVQVGTYTDARVGYLLGSHGVTINLAIATDVLGGTGSYSAAHWPKPLKVDWVRVWTPTGSTPPEAWTELPSKNVDPGGLWDDTFPASIWQSFTPDREDVSGLFDNEDNPGQLIRSTSDGNLPGGMSVDMSARTVSGTVPLTEGGRTGIMFAGSKTAGGASRLAYKYWNVAPAVQPSLFHDCYPSLGESFSRTIAFTDFHSGNLGPHTYQVTKSQGGTDLTITGNGGQSVVISGTIATAEKTVLRIDCVNTVGQVTTVTRVIDAAPRPFHWDFVNGIYRHQGVTYADLPAVVTAGKATYATTVPTSGSIYSQDLAGNLTSRASNIPRLSERGLVYEGQITNQMAAALGADNRVLNNVTVTADVLTGVSGSVSADRILETVTNGSHYVSSRTGGVNFTQGLPYFGQAYMKLGSARYGQLAFSSTPWPSAEAYINCDLLRGRIAKAGTAVTLSGVEMAHWLGKGWYRFWFFATCETTAAAANGLMAGFTGENSAAAKQPAYAGSTNQFFYLWGVGSEQRDPLTVALGLPVFLNNQLTGSTAATNLITKVADALSVFVPTGITGLRVVFDDDNTQDIAGLTPNALNAIPTPSVTTPGALNRRFIREIFGLYTAYSMAVDPAGYDLTGNDVTLARTGGAPIDYVMPADAGSYGLTGNAVGARLSATRMTADTGFYTLTGYTASLNRSGGPRRVDVASTAYVVTGLDVSLTVGGAVVPLPRNIQADLSTLRTVGVVELFEYDDRNIGGATVLRWHAGTTVRLQPVYWQGKRYDPFPVEATGFSLAASGQLPRPTLSAANIGGTLGAYLRTISDAVGAKITRRRTLTRYLDAINFPDGNPYADPNAHFPDDVYFIARKARVNAILVEIELAMSYDVSGVQLPGRQVLAGTCPWVYRSPECGYAGPPVQDIQGNPTSDPTKDKCRKTLSACKARFGTHGILNTGAFPGSALVSGG